MAKKRRAKKTGRIKTRKASKRARKTPADALKKVRSVTVGANGDVWALQDALRKKRYFARAVSAKKVVTTAPASVA